MSEFVRSFNNLPPELIEYINSFAKEMIFDEQTQLTNYIYYNIGNRFDISSYHINKIIIKNDIKSYIKENYLTLVNFNKMNESTKTNIINDIVKIIGARLEYNDIYNYVFFG
uniref:Uncharacterized protein n=1 Tax=Megaviridae environmental sample TaxID=1737588 RepID=A0A5J6VM80_9VIRU|nr:MAG: hypothetical protein [Megaviridae environmental sample]